MKDLCKVLLSVPKVTQTDLTYTVTLNKRKKYTHDINARTHTRVTLPRLANRADPVSETV